MARSTLLKRCDTEVEGGGGRAAIGTPIATPPSPVKKQTAFQLYFRLLALLGRIF
jgi:hypothetical protein